MTHPFASLAIALIVATASGAHAQQDTNAAPAQERVALATGNEAKHEREADARHCLDLKSDREIIRCAEPYRYRASARR